MKTMLKIVKNDEIATTALRRSHLTANNTASRRQTTYKPPALSLVPAPVAPKTTTGLEVTVTDIKVTKGQIMLAIYDKESNFGHTRRFGSAQPAVEGEVTFKFPDLSPGNYAVMVFQDTNNNGKLDTNILGIPKEPWGGSLQGKKVFGAPDWSDVKFSLPQDGMALTIPLQ